MFKLEIIWLKKDWTTLIQPHSQSRGVLRKNCSENKEQIYRGNTHIKVWFQYKVAFQLYWNHTSAWVFSCKFAAYFQTTFL